MFFISIKIRAVIKTTHNNYKIMLLKASIKKKIKTLFKKVQYRS